MFKVSLKFKKIGKLKSWTSLANLLTSCPGITCVLHFVQPRPSGAGSGLNPGSGECFKAKLFLSVHSKLHQLNGVHWENPGKTWYSSSCSSSWPHMQQRIMYQEIGLVWFSTVLLPCTWEQLSVPSASWELCLIHKTAADHHQTCNSYRGHAK